MKTYKQFDIDSNKAREDLYEGYGAAASGAMRFLRPLGRLVSAGTAVKALTDTDNKKPQATPLRDRPDTRAGAYVRTALGLAGALTPIAPVTQAIANVANDRDVRRSVQSFAAKFGIGKDPVPDEKLPDVEPPSGPDTRGDKENEQDKNKSGNLKKGDTYKNDGCPPGYALKGNVCKRKAQ